MTPTQPIPPQVDQASRLRELISSRRPTRKLARTIAVTSGKGGVGKTNVAVNLAICLAARGLRVTLVDVDMGLANADLLLDARCAYNLSHVVSGLRRIDQAGTQAAGRIFFVPGASGMEGVANLSEFERQNLIAQLDLLKPNADVIILDCGAGISPSVLSFALAADICLLIATPEPTSLADAYALIKVLVKQGRQGTTSLLVNLAESRQEARQVHTRISSVAERFLEYPIARAGYIVQDSHVELAVRQRCPFVLRYPRCPASACMAAVAGRFLGRSSISRPPGNVFRRVVGLFV